MQSEKKLYRTRGSLIGGVCSGVAEYFNIDPIIVQILTVLLTLVTGGLFAIPYIILWVIIPTVPNSNEPVEVQPQEVHSETYGQVPYYQIKQKEETSTAHAQVSQTSIPYDPYSGVAHVPPTPPASVPSPNPNMPPVPPVAPVAEPRSGIVSGALWFGFLLLFIGIVALFGAFVSEVAWWQFWPLILVISGIGMMVVPGKKGHRMEHFVNGLMLFAFGVSVLLMSLDIVNVSSAPDIFFSLWPMLLIMCGFFVLGTATKFPVFILLGGFSFVAFCFVGIGWFSTPGLTDTVSFVLPFGQDYIFDLNPWV